MSFLWLIGLWGKTPNWVKMAIAGALFVVGLYAYAHHQGAASANAKWEARIAEEKRLQDKVIDMAEKRADAEVERLTKELEEQNELIGVLRAEAALDPNAGKSGLPASSVRRLNRISPYRPKR